MQFLSCARKDKCYEATKAVSTITKPLSTWEMLQGNRR